MSLPRQGGHYLAIGGVQWLLDWGVMVGLSAAGLPVEAANIAGRVCGAAVGFWLNGRITFAGDGTEVGARQLRRFVVLWLCTTTVSTVAVHLIEDGAGLRWAWVLKPLVDLTLGLTGFLVSRHWVYRKHAG